MIQRVGNVQGAAPINDATMRPVQAGCGGISALAFCAPGASCDRRDDVASCINPANRVVLGVDDENVAVPVTAYALGTVERGLPGLAAVAAVAAFARARDRSDDAARVHDTDLVALTFADVRVPLAVHAHGPWADEQRFRRRSTVADVAHVELHAR